MAYSITALEVIAMLKKSISMALCALLSALMLTGCSLLGSGSGRDRTLIVSIWDVENQDVYRELADAYAEENPGLIIELRTIEPEKYAATLLQSFSSKDAADVVAIPAEEFHRLTSGGKLMDLSKSDIIPDNYDKNLLQIGSRDGSQWAIPVTGSVPVVFYNKADYENYKLIQPKTISDFIINCSILRQNGRTPLAMATDDKGRYMPADLVESMLANGPCDTALLFNGRFFTTNTELDSGFMDVIGLAFELDMQDMLVGKGDSAQGHEALLAQFADGGVSMIPGDTNDIRKLRNLDSNFNFGFFPMPGSSDTVCGVFKAELMLGITKGTKVKADAEGFIRYLLTESSQTRLCNKTMTVPAVDNVQLEDGDLQEALALLDKTNERKPSLFQRISKDNKEVCLDKLDLAFNGEIGGLDDFMQDWKDKIKSNEAEPTKK
jgi:ABC-type glycerol-3-phosphate transport system substrate-binding protein